MGYQPTRSCPNERPPIPPKARIPHRSLVRCEWCGMAYDGDAHDNCPHCLGARPRSDAPRMLTFYADDVPYYVEEWRPDPREIRDELARTANDLMEATRRARKRRV